MRTAALVLVLAFLLLTGCAHSQTHAKAGGVRVHGHSHGLAAVVIAGVFVAAALDEEEQRTMPPAMAEDRRINEQDCTRPIDETAGNLKCR